MPGIGCTILSPWVRLFFRRLFCFLTVFSGAFAFFGPGVYENGDIYSEMLQPAANGKLFFAGEATSACHAYVDSLLAPAVRF